MKKVRLVGMIFLMLLFSLTALGSAREKIEVWIGHDSWVPYLMHFNEIQDKYEIEWIIQGSTDAFLTAVAAGKPPDVFRTGPMLNLAASGVLQPLDPYIERDGIDLSAFLPGIMRSLQWKGTTYALPLNGDSRLVYYNIDRFESVGLDSNSPPSTWAEMEAAARRLNVWDADGTLTHLGYSWWSNHHQFHGYLHQLINGVFNEDLTDIAFDVAAMDRVISWIVDSQNTINGGNANIDQFLSPYGGSHSNAFAAGNYGMNFDVPARMAQNERENPNLNYGLFPIPVAEGGRRTSISGGHRVTIPVGAKNPEGAWEFIKWLTSYEAGMEFAEPGFTQRYIDINYQGIGQSMSARLDVNLDAPFYRETWGWRDFAQDMVYAIDYPIHPAHEEILAVLRKYVEQVMRQEISVSEALEYAAHESRVLMDRWE